MPSPHRSDVSSKHTPAVHLWVPAAEAIAAKNAQVFERGAHGNQGFAGGFHGDPSEIGSLTGIAGRRGQRSLAGGHLCLAGVIPSLTHQRGAGSVPGKLLVFGDRLATGLVCGLADL